MEIFMDILIGMIIVALMSAVLSAWSWMKGEIFNYNEKRMQLYTKLFWYSLVIADIIFLCIILIKV